MEDERPTRITYEEAEQATACLGTVDFEGREARVVSVNNKPGMFDEPSAQLGLDLGDKYLTLHGCFDRSTDEFVKTRRERPF